MSSASGSQRASFKSSSRKEARLGSQDGRCSPTGSEPAKQAMLNSASQAIHGNTDLFDRYLINTAFRRSALSERRDVAFLRLINFAAASDKWTRYTHPFTDPFTGVIQDVTNHCKRMPSASSSGTETNDDERSISVDCVDLTLRALILHATHIRDALHRHTEGTAMILWCCSVSVWRRAFRTWRQEVVHRLHDFGLLLLWLASSPSSIGIN